VGFATVGFAFLTLTQAQTSSFCKLPPQAGQKDSLPEYIRKYRRLSQRNNTMPQMHGICFALKVMVIFGTPPSKCAAEVASYAFLFTKSKPFPAT
jgi:hypothetical protein